MVVDRAVPGMVRMLWRQQPLLRVFSLVDPFYWNAAGCCYRMGKPGEAADYLILRARLPNPPQIGDRRPQPRSTRPTEVVARPIAWQFGDPVSTTARCPLLGAVSLAGSTPGSMRSAPHIGVCPEPADRRH
jgi:hypothetical protein